MDAVDSIHAGFEDGDQGGHSRGHIGGVYSRISGLPGGIEKDYVDMGAWDD
jgi:hypothetical protein